MKAEEDDDDVRSIELEVDVDVVGDRAKVQLRGELDVYTAPRLREALAELADRGGVRVELDMSHMTFVDSTGLGVLVSALKRLRQGAGDMVLRAPTPATRKALEITGLLSVLKVEDGDAPAPPRLRG